MVSTKQLKFCISCKNIMLHIWLLYKPYNMHYLRAWVLLIISLLSITKCILIIWLLRHLRASSWGTYRNQPNMYIVIMNRVEHPLKAFNIRLVQHLLIVFKINNVKGHLWDGASACHLWKCRNRAFCSSCNRNSPKTGHNMKEFISLTDCSHKTEFSCTMEVLLGQVCSTQWKM